MSTLECFKITSYFQQTNKKNTHKTCLGRPMKTTEGMYSWLFVHTKIQHYFGHSWRWFLHRCRWYSFEHWIFNPNAPIYQIVQIVHLFYFFNHPFRTEKCVLSSAGMQSDASTLHKTLQAKIKMYSIFSIINYTHLQVRTSTQQAHEHPCHCSNALQHSLLQALLPLLHI